MDKGIRESLYVEPQESKDCLQPSPEKKIWIKPLVEELNCKDTAAGLLLGPEILVLLRNPS